MKKILFIVSLFLIGSEIVSAQRADGMYLKENENPLVNASVDQENIADIDSLLNMYNSKMYLSEDPECDYKNENCTYPKEVYIDRLKRLPNVIEMPYNDEVREMIDKYTGRLRRSVSYMLGASNFYMPLFEKVLETYNLPLELKYLPIIESALNPNAVSRVGAAGLWQFMVQTGKQYGLKVNSLVDERRDPVKSSYAAARFLSDLYKIYGDWSLVIAAYNCGPENVRKAMHRSGKSDFWGIYPYLPRETQGYVPAFIAANYVMNYYCKHNICPMVCELPAKTDTVMVNSNIHFGQIEGVIGVSVEQLRSLNPQYRRDIINGDTELSAITLPADRITLFIDSLNSIKQYQPEKYIKKRDEVQVEKKSSKHRRGNRGGRRTITIRSGQTLSQIAKQHNTTVSKLKRLNGLKGTNIRAGKKLRVR